MQNGRECPYERPVALQCTRPRVISPITDKINEILTSRKICATARYGELCSSPRESERTKLQERERERDAVKALEMNFEILDRENESASAMGKNYI